MWGFPCDSAGKESTCNAGHPDLVTGLERSTGEGKKLPTPVFWPGEFHGLYSPRGHKERTRLSDFHFPSLSFSSFTFHFHALEKEMATQCSCLENPRDGEPGGLPSMGSHRVGHD